MPRKMGHIKNLDRAIGTPGRGFTLIELLVVVSIVALLISILLPALKGAREQAKIAMCSANLRAIAVASLTYAADDRHEQAIPLHPLTGVVPRDIGAYDWGGKSGVGEPTMGTDPMSSIWGTGEGGGPGTRPLNDVIFKDGFPNHASNAGPNQINWANDATLDLPVFRCPSDRGFTGHHLPTWAESRLSSYDHYGTSYFANNFLWPRSTDGKVYSFGPSFNSLDRIPNPGNTVYYLENCGRFGWFFDYLTNPERYAGVMVPPAMTELSPTPSVRGWHGRGFHFVSAFIDGHVAMVKMREKQWPAPHLAYYPQFFGNYPCPDGCIYENFHLSTIVRGANWQIDTLPANPIGTHIPGPLNTVAWHTAWE